MDNFPAAELISNTSNVGNVGDNSRHSDKACDEPPAALGTEAESLNPVNWGVLTLDSANSGAILASTGALSWPAGGCMRMNQCWWLCAAAAAAIAVLDGGRGIVPFFAVDSLIAIAIAISLAALWGRFDHEDKKLLRTAKAALMGGILMTAANATITLMREANTVLLPQRLALGLTGLLYGAAIAGIMLAIAERRAAAASPIKVHI